MDVEPFVDRVKENRTSDERVDVVYVQPFFGIKVLTSDKPRTRRGIFQGQEYPQTSGRPVWPESA
jgi:hypothetical protein